MTNEIKHPTVQTDQNGWDDLTEDLIGLNLRGGRTVWDMFMRPAVVFDAARTSDWRRKYTPSLRLFLSLIAVLLLFKFFWAGEDTMLRGVFEQLFRDIDSTNPNMFEGNPLSIEEMGGMALERYLLIYPFTTAFFFIIASLLTFVWGKGTSTTTRIRLFFAALIPNATVSIPVTLGTSGISENWGLGISLVAILLILFVDGGTVWRGLALVHQGAGRFWRSVLFAFISFTTMMVANTTAQLIAGGWTGYEAGHRSAIAKHEAEREILRNAIPDDGLPGLKDKLKPDTDGDTPEKSDAP